MESAPARPKRTRLRRIADRELMREDWLAVARKTLIEEGIAAVKVERLAKALGVTRGGFYWRYQNLDDLLTDLLEDWRRGNTETLIAAIERPGPLAERFDRAMRVWVDETDFSPAWDSAVRDWARTSPSVSAAVRAVDEARIAALQRMFQDAGLASDPALIRARVTYYHQVGYYALGIHQSPARRKALLPLYEAVLTGLDPEGRVTPRDAAAATTKSAVRSPARRRSPRPT